ncbi:hypothetical protein BDV93DRAFT_525070 [Ceratobasidium sp. AG-I]|nr:hypothetical protein BDV93DRAFT_525070 [Ceratobasidium sp. AG-I]
MKVSRILFPISLLNFAYAATGPSWTGFQGLRYLFAFGDSYTTVGYNSWAPNPSDVNPLGVVYPGSTAGGANWVAYLTVQYNQSKFWTYDYAVSGNTVSGVGNQVINDFLPNAGTKPAYAPWDATNSLFATFIGINDLNLGEDITPDIAHLIDLQESPYDVGARNFLFVNVPPTNRAPFSHNNATLASLITTWNSQLQTSIATFRVKYPEVTAFYYDSWTLYTKLLDNPATYGFTDVDMIGGSFWVDTIHPTTKVQQYMAQDLAAFLQRQGDGTTGPVTTSTVPGTTTSTTSTPASTSTGTVPKYGQWYPRLRYLKWVVD